MGDNAFEAEVRALVDPDFLPKMLKKGAKRLNNLAYQDDYYLPTGGMWDPDQITLRLRKFEGNPIVAVLFSHVTFIEREGLRVKRSVYPQGKIKLFSGSESHAKQLLQDCGFRYWFSVKKLQSSLLSFGGVEFAVEHVDDLGWTVELEGDGSEPERAISDLITKLTKLGIPKSVLMKHSLPKEVAMARGLL